MGTILTSSQCRGARAMLDWSQGHLASTAGISRQTIVDFERGARTPYKSSLTTLRTALEQAGIEFILEDDRGVGVWLKPRAPTLSPGEQAVAELEKILEAAATTGDWNAALQDRIDACMDRLVNDSSGDKSDRHKGLQQELDRVEARAQEAMMRAHGAEGDFWLVVLDLVRTYR
jgi:DNA-binding XRE family transcriptional regulator